jgi:hypothetical protein
VEYRSWGRTSRTDSEHYPARRPPGSQKSLVPEHIAEPGDTEKISQGPAVLGGPWVGDATDSAAMTAVLLTDTVHGPNHGEKIANAEQDGPN